jgi:hypothetical protein
MNDKPKPRPRPAAAPQPAQADVRTGPRLFASANEALQQSLDRRW